MNLERELWDWPFMKAKAEVEVRLITLVAALSLCTFGVLVEAYKLLS